MGEISERVNTRHNERWTWIDWRGNKERFFGKADLGWLNIIQLATKLFSQAQYTALQIVTLVLDNFEQPEMT